MKRGWGIESSESILIGFSLLALPQMIELLKLIGGHSNSVGLMLPGLQPEICTFNPLQHTGPGAGGKRSESPQTQPQGDVHRFLGFLIKQYALLIQFILWERKLQ